MAVVKFNHTESVETLVGVEDVAFTHTRFADLYMYHLRFACGKKEQRKCPNKYQCDKKIILIEKCDRNKRTGDNNDRCVPIIGVMNFRMFKRIPLHTISIL